MATVRISRTLLDDVRCNIDMMYTASVKGVNPNPTTDAVDPDELVTCITDTFWKGAEHFYDAPFPTDWISYSSSFDIYFLDNTQNRVWNPMITTKTPVKMPPTQKGVASYRYVTLQIMEPIWSKYPSIAKEIGRAVEARAEQQAKKQEYDAIAAKIQAFLNSAPSLNKAIDTWPGVAMYVPKNWLHIVGEKVAPRSKANPRIMEIPSDADSLTTLAVGHKLLNNE